MPRPIWKGNISFGLVNVPVTLYSAEQSVSDISFRMLDSRNSARVRYERVNEETGEEVPWDKIVKGYEYEKGHYVLLSDEELESASAELTKLVEIVQFVDADAIDPMFFDKPYVLVPGKGGEKGYALLREAMEKSGQVGIAQVVMRARGYLAALMARGDALVLEVLRYQDELRNIKEFDIPERAVQTKLINKKELDLAQQLIDGMKSDWNPEQYRDEYRDALMKMIERRIESGDTEKVGVPDRTEVAAPRTMNFMEVLKESLKENRKPKDGKTARRSAKQPRQTSRARKTKAG
jgi:DNA end-binding protein Ku